MTPFSLFLGLLLMTLTNSAACLLRVIDGLDVADSGGLFAWDGKAIEY